MEYEHNDMVKKIADLMADIKDTYGKNLNVSVVAVIGDTNTSEIDCIPLIEGGFEQPTFDLLDRLVSQVKVMGFPTADSPNANIVLNKGGEITQVDKGELAENLTTALKDDFRKMVAEFGEKKARQEMLNGIVVSTAQVVVDNAEEWVAMSVDERVKVINDLLDNTLRKDTDWFPADITEHEIATAIDDTDYQLKFGYKRDTGTDIGYN